MKNRTLLIAAISILASGVITSNAHAATNADCVSMGYEGQLSGLICSSIPTSRCPNGMRAQAVGSRGCGECVCKSAPAGAPSPTNATECNSGSGCFQPPASKSTQYQSQTTNSTPANNFNFSGSQFQPCVKSPDALTTTDASNFNSTVKDYTSSDYADINNTAPSSGTALADQCVASSRVLCRVNGVDNQPCTSTSQTITSAIAATCPDGYVQVSAFNMQPEVAYNSSSITVNSPTDIPDMDTYQHYRNLGYVCSVPSYDMTLFSPCNDAPAGGNNSYTFSYGRLTPYPNPTGGPGVVMFHTISLYDKYTSQNRCYTGAAGLGCGGPPGYGVADAACNLSTNSGYPTYGTNGINSSTISVYLDGGAIDFHVQFGFSYGYIQCTLPIGPYFTNNMAPRSLVCARIKSQYDKVN